MKLTTLLNSAGSLAVGYVLGSAAGRSRYAQIKAAAADLLLHPKVQQVACDLAEKARTNADRLPGPAAGLVSQAANRLEDQLTSPTIGPDAPSSGADGSVATPEAPATRPGPPLS